MVGLGNSCRGMKSPPLLVAALVACIIVLGFNYWIASSRSMDLQGRVMDLEGKVRRAAAERGAVEQKKNEFQGELEKQRQQIDKIQSLHNFQMENANRVHQEEKIFEENSVEMNLITERNKTQEKQDIHNLIAQHLLNDVQLVPQQLSMPPGQLSHFMSKYSMNEGEQSEGVEEGHSNMKAIEKAMLMSNISESDRLIQSLREHLKDLQREYGKLQVDVYWFQKNQTNLQKKFSYDLSQCINQMKELKEQCEERADELTKKSSGVPQIKKNKDFTEDSQVNAPLPALKQTGFKQTDLVQQKTSEDVPKAVPTVRKTDLVQAKERTDSLPDIRKQEPKAEEEQLSSQLKEPQESLKAAAGPKEILPESDKEPNPPEDEKHVPGQDALEPAAEQAASEEFEREQFLNYDDKQDDLLPGEADKQEHEAVNQDKDVDYNLDMNEAESETDKQAALAGIENVQNPEDTKNHLPDREGQQKL